MNSDTKPASAGPGPRIDFMEQLEPLPIAETLVAFANTDGGSLLFGARADDETVAVSITQEALDSALGEAQGYCDPPVLTGERTLVALAEARTAWRLDVPRSMDMHSLGDGRVLVRSGDCNRPLGGREIQRLASARNVGDFENEVVPGASRSDFSEEIIAAYLARRSLRLRQPTGEASVALLQEIGALDAEGNPTVTGVLLFCERPQRWLPQSGMVFVRFAGVTPRGEDGLAGYIRREELTGPLSRMVETAWNLVWSEMAVSAVVKDLEREETLEYPRFAVREAIVNAVCHRDYRIKGRRIEIRMFADRLEVVSPGGLPGFITVENFVGEHFSRNPRIVSGLFQWGLIEELGLGIDRMLEVMEQAGHEPPGFDAQPYSFAVTLCNAREQAPLPAWVASANPRQQRALQYLREHGSITNREYRTRCQGVSSETLRLDLVDLVEQGILLKVGTKKGTYYILKQGTQQSSAGNGQPRQD